MPVKRLFGCLFGVRLFQYQYTAICFGDIDCPVFYLYRLTRQANDALDVVIPQPVAWVKYDNVASFRFVNSVDKFIHQQSLFIPEIRLHAGTIDNEGLDCTSQTHEDYQHYCQQRYKFADRTFHC